MGERRLRRLVSLFFAVAAIAAALVTVPTAYLTVRPGPVVSLAGMIEVQGYSQPPNSFFMVSVLAREARVLDLVKAYLEPTVGVWDKAAVYRGKSPESYREGNLALMDESRRTATYLAFRESGFEVEQGGEPPVPVVVDSGEVMGSSAGLAFALQIVSTLRGTDLTGGRKIAATGMLGPDGAVIAVGGVPQKAAACSREGIELLLVPAGLEEEARRFARTVEVVGVRSLSGAVKYLMGLDIP